MPLKKHLLKKNIGQNLKQSYVAISTILSLICLLFSSFSLFYSFVSFLFIFDFEISGKHVRSGLQVATPQHIIQ